MTGHLHFAGVLAVSFRRALRYARAANGTPPLEKQKLELAVLQEARRINDCMPRIFAERHDIKIRYVRFRLKDVVLDSGDEALSRL